MNLKRITLDDTVEETVNKINENSADIEENVSRLEADFIPFKDNITLKTSKIEKELNDYKATMQQVNINQEPKQKATGYGMVSLPKNAANGQVSGVVRGQTLTNYYNHDNLRFSTGDVLSEKLETGFKLVKQSNSIRFVNDTLANLKAGTYTLVCYVKENTTVSSNDLEVIYPDDSKGYFRIFGGGYVGYYKRAFTFNKDVRQIRFYIQSVEEDGVGYTLENILFLEADWTNKEVPASYITGTKSTVGAMRLKSVSADETETSTAYVVAKDSEGKIAELRSLPNGTKDEINVSAGRVIIKNKNYVLHENDIIEHSFQGEENYRVEFAMPSDIKTASSSPDWDWVYVPGWSRDLYNNRVTTIGKYYTMTHSGQMKIIFCLPYGTTLEQAREQLAGLTLNYQLAEPVEIPVQVSGNLISYPSGTIYVEPFIADAGVYADKIEVLHQDLPIKAIEQLSKVDFMTGIEVPLDVGEVEIDESGLSFTHPDLSEGDIVFFEYEYDLESTQGETEIEYYDSRYTIKDSVTDKFYKWHIIVADGVPSIELVEV